MAIVPREGAFTVEQTESSFVFAWWNVRPADESNVRHFSVSILSDIPTNGTFSEMTMLFDAVASFCVRYALL